MNENKTLRLRLQQDLGLLGFIAGLFTILLLGMFAGEEEQTESLIMFLVFFVPVLFCGFKMRAIAYILSGLQLLVYAVYRIYEWSSMSRELTVTAYGWIVVPVVTILAFGFYNEATMKMELNNELLREQVQELVMVDPLTGMYNLRSLINDLTRQMAYVERNDLNITLMIIKLKYAPELKKILSRRQFEELLQGMANILEDELRVEDRIYTLDSDGSFAMLLTCDKPGAKVGCK